MTNAAALRDTTLYVANVSLPLVPKALGLEVDAQHSNEGAPR